MPELICYPLLPEPFYYATPEQQEGYYSSKESARKNIDICEGRFESIAINVRAWVVVEAKRITVRTRLNDAEKLTGFTIHSTDWSLQEALDYLVARIALGLWKDD